MYSALKARLNWAHAGALTVLAALGLLASSAGAFQFDHSFPMTSFPVRSGSLAASVTCNLDPNRGFFLKVDFQSGSLGAESFALDANGHRLGDVADTAILLGTCRPPAPGAGPQICQTFFQSPVNPVLIRTFVF